MMSDFATCNETGKRGKKRKRGVLTFRIFNFPLSSSAQTQPQRLGGRGEKGEERKGISIIIFSFFSDFRSGCGEVKKKEREGKKGKKKKKRGGKGKEEIDGVGFPRSRRQRSAQLRKEGKKRKKRERKKKIRLPSFCA